MAKLFKYLEENFLSWGIIVLLLFIPLYPKFPLFNVPGTYVAIRIEDFLVGFILGIWLILEAKKGWPVFKEKIAVLILWYFLAGALTVINAVFITKIVSPHLVILHYLRRIEYMSLFFIGFSTLKDKEKIRQYIYVLILTALGVAVFGIGQKYYNWPVISTMNEEFSKGVILRLTEWTRINSTFAGHYDLAAYVILLISIFLGFIIGVKSIALKLIALIGYLFSFYLLLLTESRVSFVAYLIAVTFILLFVRRKWFIVPVLAVSLTAMVLGSDLGQRYAATFRIDLSFLSANIKLKKDKPVLPQPTLIPTPTTAVVEPVPTVSLSLVQQTKETPTPTPILEPINLYPTPEPVQLATQRSGEIRFKVEWPRSLRAFTKNPLLGTGYSSVTLATDNDYLRALAETGLVGFGAMVLIFLQLTADFVVYLKKTAAVFEKAVVVGFMGAVIGFLVNAVFIDVFEASKVAFVFWLFVGLMTALMKKNIKTKQS